MRWNIRVELTEDEIARLYAQGLARGALVWRADMDGWRPLLTTPELSNRLMHTRITLTDASDKTLDDEVTLPRPARLPSDVATARSAGADESARDVPTVAPTALDVVTPPPRRRGELLLVAAAAFALAWFARGSAEPGPGAPAAAAPTARTAPATPSPTQPARSLDATSLIPVVAVADLPLLGSTAMSSRSGVGASNAARAARSFSAPSSGGEGPTRQELLAALGRVANVASGCGERDGVVRVVITFANSGVARSIQVSGSGLPAPVRSCIIGAASRARIASFSGAPVTVAKSL